MATTTMTSPTPASEKSMYFDAPILHVHTTGAQLMTVPGTAEPIEARVDGMPTPVYSPAAMPTTTTSPDAAAPQPTVVGADVPRKRSLLKRRSLRSKAEPTPAPEPSQAANTTTHDPTQMPVPQPAPAPTATADETSKPASEEPVTRKRSLLKRRSLRSKPDPVTTTESPAKSAAAQLVEQDKPEPSNASPTTDGVLSRDYTRLSGPSTRSIKSVSISPPPVVTPAATAPALSPSRSRPQSRATNKRASGVYGDSDSDEGAYSDVDSDEPDVASYNSPVSHGGRASRSRRRTTGHRRTQTLDNRPAASAATELVRSRSRPRSTIGAGGSGVRRANTAASHRTNRTTATNKTAVSVVSEGGAFGHGAGTVGPAAVPEPEESEVFRQRAAAAGQSLNAKQSKRIFKEELKEGKRLSKILRAEGKAERQALLVALKELSELQSAQKIFVKGEGKAHSAHAKALKASHLSELALLKAQRKHELAQTALAAEADALEYARRRALEATQAVAAKNREVDLLRAQKGADSREREVKMTLIQGKTRR